MKQFTFKELRGIDYFSPTVKAKMEELTKVIIWMRETKNFELWRLTGLEGTYEGRDTKFTIRVKDVSKFTHNKLVTIRRYNYKTDRTSNIKRVIQFQK